LVYWNPYIGLSESPFLKRLGFHVPKPRWFFTFGNNFSPQTKPGLVFAGGFADDLDGAGCLFAGWKDISCRVNPYLTGKPNPEGRVKFRCGYFLTKTCRNRWNMNILKTPNSWSFGLEDFSFGCDV